MAYPIDPLKCRYYPEVFAEAGFVESSPSGTEMAYYSSFNDYMVQLVSLATVPMTLNEGSIRVNTDAGDNVINSVVGARPYQNTHTEVKATGVTSMALYGYYPPGGAAADILYQYGIRVTKPTVYEKLLHNIPLTDEEHALDVKFGISKMILAGTASGRIEPQFTTIIEVAKEVDITADVPLTIDRVVHPLSGTKAVLLGLCIGNYATDSIMFLSVRRDGEQVMKLDAYGFADVVGGSLSADQDGMNYSLSCYIVALDELEIFVESSIADTEVMVHFRYGIAPLTIIDKIKWGLPLTEASNAIANELDLFESVRAGVR